MVHTRMRLTGIMKQTKGTKKEEKKKTKKKVGAQVTRSPFTPQPQPLVAMAAGHM